ncbi:hypothetical protein EJ110_NYTH48338 [Nymphaea thermarum]|nr:hypothetical protein EJ110_NYTH48338 [Nymphaea thermarum]
MRLEQANLCVGLRDGLRSKVLTSRPRDLDKVVTMARCIEEDWARTRKDHHKKAGQHSHGGRTQVRHQHFAGRARPYERRDDRTFRRNRPNRSETTQGSVASPTSPKFPTCSRVHPGKPCYREIGACLHCGGMRHFIKDCPLKKERELKKPEAARRGLFSLVLLSLSPFVASLVVRELHVKKKQAVGGDRGDTRASGGKAAAVLLWSEVNALVVAALRDSSRLGTFRTLEVGIAGVPADTIMKKTKTIEDNWSPSWNEEFQFPLTVPELALLQIEVHEYDMSEKDDFGGQACFPISELQTGIRAVPLFDKKGEKFRSSREVPALLFITYPLLFIPYPLLFITYPTPLFTAALLTVHARRSYCSLTRRPRLCRRLSLRLAPPAACISAQRRLRFRRSYPATPEAPLVPAILPSAACGSVRLRRPLLPWFLSDAILPASVSALLFQQRSICLSVTSASVRLQRSDFHCLWNHRPLLVCSAAVTVVGLCPLFARCLLSLPGPAYCSVAGPWFLSCSCCRAG